MDPYAIWGSRCCPGVSYEAHARGGRGFADEVISGDSSNPGRSVRLTTEITVEREARTDDDDNEDAMRRVFAKPSVRIQDPDDVDMPKWPSELHLQSSAS